MSVSRIRSRPNLELNCKVMIHKPKFQSNLSPLRIHPLTPLRIRSPKPVQPELPKEHPSTFISRPQAHGGTTQNVG